MNWRTRKTKYRQHFHASLCRNLQTKRLLFISLIAAKGTFDFRVALEEDAESSKGPRRQLTDFIGDAKDTQYSQEELMKRKEDLMDWLSRNRVPVSEYSENSTLLSVMGVLLVEPPYGPDCGRCSNEIILDCVQKLIKAKKGHDKCARK